MGFAGRLSGLKPLPQGVPVESEAAFRKGASEIFFLQVESGQLLRALSQGCWLSGLKPLPTKGQSKVKLSSARGRQSFLFPQESGQLLGRGALARDAGCRD